MRTVTLGFLLGILAASRLPVMPDPKWAWLSLAASLGLLLFRGRARHPRIVPMSAAFLVGAALFVSAAGRALDQRLTIPAAGVDRVVSGRVIGLPESDPNKLRFMFAPDVVQGQQDLPSQVLISWYYRGAKETRIALPKAGERWCLTLRLRRPRGQANPGGFDYEQWLLNQGIGATAYVRKSELNRRLSEAGYSWAGLRAALAQGVDTALPDSPRAGMISALLIGSGQISAAQRQLLQQTGTSHLMAISGLHVGIAAAVGALLGRLLWHLLPLRLARVRQLSTISGALIFAFVYAGLAGFQLPTSRALTMTLVVTMALASRRSIAPWTAYAAAMTGALALNPLAPLGAGFWLSFGAVAGLLLAAPVLRRAGPGRGLLLAQWSVSVVLAPVTLAIYAQLPLLSPLANLVAVPLFTVVLVPLVLLAGLIEMIPALTPIPAAAGLFVIADIVLERFLACLDWLLRVGPEPLRPAQATARAVLAASLGACLLLLPGIRGRLAAACALLLPLLFWQGTRPASGGFDMTVLDVGQGLSAVIRTREHALVFDTGPAWPGGDSGSRTLVPFLRAVGADRVDLLLISHPDLDHRGGFPGLIDGIRVRRASGSVHVGMPILPEHGCRRGQSWIWDQVEFRMVHPVSVGGGGSNNQSCVLRVTAGGGSGATILITGDIEARAERQLVARESNLHADLVVAPHHGSKTSSSAALVAATRPEWVVYPAGYGNRWGFPHADVVRRWGGAGSLLTGVHGAVNIIVPADGSRPSVTAWRCEARRFWRWRQCEASSIPMLDFLASEFSSIMRHIRGFLTRDNKDDSIKDV